MRQADHWYRGPHRALLATAVLAALTLPAVAQADTFEFENETQIDFPSGEEGPAQPYPSNIEVSGLVGTVTRVSVSLRFVQHQFSDQMDIAVVGPNGAAVHLISDACGPDDTFRTLSFADDGPSFLSASGPCPAGTYRPTNYDGPDDAYPPPGPSEPTRNSLSSFNGINPNGTWSLFAADDQDDFDPVTGMVGGGWSLTIEGPTTPPPPADQPPPTNAPPPDTAPPPTTTDSAAPDTQITDGPSKKTRKRRASFSFTSTEPGSTFECRVDDAAFAVCPSPFETKVERARHRFEVRAIDAAGNPDTIPATDGWKVKKRKKGK